jgi:acid phosphatase (class A)
VGFLKPEQYLDSIKLVNIAPKDDSLFKQLDLSIAKNAQALAGEPRWQQAGIDAPYYFGDATIADVTCQHFACQIGVNITPDATPKLYRLLRKAEVDLSLIVDKAKQHFGQVRPFVKTDDHQTCAPWDNQALLGSPSYPSGHTAYGWMQGLLFSGIDPADQDKIMQRARQYGESRIICNVHWYSDVESGRYLASAIFETFFQSEKFVQAYEEAKAEFAEVKAKNLEVKKNWAYALEQAKTFSEANPDDPEAIFVYEHLQGIENWTCEKELEVLQSFDINSVLGREAS